MFNMGNIGLKIANMRKNTELTQMELADRLNISYQAVSSWERGQTMPDISKLHELSEIFGVSIDEILDNKRGAQIVEAVTLDKLPEEIPTITELAEVGPILSVKQIDKVAEDVMNELGSDIDMREIQKIAPFVSAGFIDEVAKKFTANFGNLKELGPIAPFMSTEAMDRIAQDIIEKSGDLSDLSPIAPFVSSGMIDEIAKTAVEKTENLKDLAPIAPFMSTGTIDGLAKAVVEKVENMSNLSPIAPFMGQVMLDGLAEVMLDKHGISAISSIAPFISDHVLEKYARNKYLK